MKFTLRELFLATAMTAMAVTLIITTSKLVEKDAELKALMGAAVRPALHHAAAEIRLVSITDPARRASTLPLATTAGSKQISKTVVSRSAPPAPNVQISVVARHLCSTDDGDVYEIFWSEQGRLPPVPHSRDFPDTSKIVQTGEGVVQIYESDQWKIEIADRSGP